MSTGQVQKVERPSFIDLTGANSNEPTNVWHNLPVRTPQIISRANLPRSSPTERCRRNSNNNNNNIASWDHTQPLTPSLLSNRIVHNSYFEDQRNVDSINTSTLKFNTSAGVRRNSSTSSIRSLLSLIKVKDRKNTYSYDRYKYKRSQSSQKLKRFFGESTPDDDVCIAEIRKNGLNALLQSKVPLALFLYHSLEEYWWENLLFFIEVERYESFQYISLVQQMATAQHIYDTYVRPNSCPLEINVDEKARKSIQLALEKRQVQTCFSLAKTAIYKLLEGCFTRFLESDTWAILTRECSNEHATTYPPHLVQTAVQLLRDNLEKQHRLLFSNPLTDPPLSSSWPTMRRSHDAKKAVIREFCLLYLGVDMDTVEDQHDINHHQQSHYHHHYKAPSSIMQVLKRQRQYVVDALNSLKNTYTHH